MACNREKDEFGLCAEPSCFTCKVKSIQIHPNATPTRTAARPAGAPPKGSSNSWERGIPTDSRGLPYINAATGDVMGQKEVSEKRHQIEAEKRRLKQAPSNPN